MKKLLILLLSAVLLCGCAGVQSEKPPEDNSTTSPETVPPPSTAAAESETTAKPKESREPETTKTDGPGISRQLFLKLNAVALTWGEPVPENDAGYEEIASDNGVIYKKVRASFDEIYFSTFEMRNYSRYPYFKISDEIIMKHLEDFVYVPKDAVNQFPAGKKQLVFLESFNNNFCIGTQKEEDGTTKITSKTFDIVDGRIHLPNGYYMPLDDYNIYNANIVLKRDYPDLPVFEDGMLLSDFGAYLDRVLSYMHS